MHSERSEKDQQLIFLIVAQRLEVVDDEEGFAFMSQNCITRSHRLAIMYKTAYAYVVPKVAEQL